MPYAPASDAESRDYPSGSPEQAMGLVRRSAQHKVVCKALIPHPDDPTLFLFGLRRDDQAWCNPGGHAELGEDPGQAMAREFMEECGVPLETAELVHSQEIAAKNLTVHVFLGPPAEPDFWLSLDASGDPDSEFVCYQFIDPLNTDLPLHIPVERSAVAAYLQGEDKTAYANSLQDLTTASVKPGEPGYTDDFSGRVMNRLGQAPDALFKGTDDMLGDAYHNENQFEDIDLHLQGAAEPYAQGGMSPADQMLEYSEDMPIVQHAVSTENSSGLGVREENERADFELMKDLSIRTPL